MLSIKFDRINMVTRTNRVNLKSALTTFVIGVFI